MKSTTADLSVPTLFVAMSRSSRASSIFPPLEWFRLADSNPPEPRNLNPPSDLPVDRDDETFDRSEPPLRS